MKNILFLILFLCLGCSTDSIPEEPEPTQTNNSNYFHIYVSGTDWFFYDNKHAFINGNQLSIGYGTGFIGLIGGNYVGNECGLSITFDKQGNFLYAKKSCGDLEYGNVYYQNYKNFPSNYFNLNLISIDEISKRIKGTFSGKLYLNDLNLSSESVEVHGEFNMNYEGDETQYSGIQVSGFPQYCSAKFNSILWKATQEYEYGSFTSSDAYKLDIHLAPNTTPDTFEFNSQSIDNYVKLSKFNTTTLVYDYYNTMGVVAYTYKEFHGLTNYSFFGTFSFTAVNPANPSDIIQVTDGDFRSYQQF